MKICSLYLQISKKSSTFANRITRKFNIMKRFAFILVFCSLTSVLLHALQDSDKTYNLENFDTYIERLDLQRVELTDKKLENFLTEFLRDKWYDLYDEEYLLLDTWLEQDSITNTPCYDFHLYCFYSQMHLMRQFKIQYYVNIEGHYIFLRDGWVDELYDTTTDRKKLSFEISPIPLIVDVHSYHIKYSTQSKKYYVHEAIW